MTIRDDLQSALGASYTLERELAGGGMSRVFVATETALGRTVVVKVLHPDLAATVTTERFTREIRLAARLQHANIVPLLAAGTTGALPFYTMPFVAGDSIRQRLAQAGSLPLAESIGILRDVARALAYAHDAGVVHRDIKPENVLLSGGAAIVTDFGIAKAISAARTASGNTTLTQAGTMVGTPAYMAPEQATGDPAADHRVDIYAFGCLAFELLCGRPPFEDKGVHQLVAAHMTRTPPSVVSIRADVPPALSTLVARCLEKEPANRPQVARDVLDVLDTASTPMTRAEALRGSRRRLAVSAAVALVAAVGTAAYFTSHRRGGAPLADSTPAIAVIPFVNVGGDSAQDYLADGLSDEIATSVGQIPGVRVAARSGVYRYRGRRDLDVREVGRALNVAYIVQGSVREAGDQLRVSAQLADANTGVELWSHPFDGARRDVFRTQDRIAAAISGALTSRIGTAPLRRGATSGATVASTGAKGTADVDAYDAYLRGEFLLRRRQVADAERMFLDAIRRDPKFGRAYAGLSQTLALTPYYATTPANAVLQRVLDASDRALAIDSALAEAHMSRAIALMNVFRWSEAREAFERAVRADPGDADTHFQFGRWYYHRGDSEGALGEWAKVLALDPFSALASSWSGLALLARGRVGEAVPAVNRAVVYDSTAAVIKLIAGRVYVAAGDRVKGLAFADRLPDAPPWPGGRAYVHGLAGDRVTAAAIARRFRSRSPLPWFGHTVLASAALASGDTTTFFTELERATDAKENWATFLLLVDPPYDVVRGSARWTALAQRVGLEGTPIAPR